jgi:hypothetical protein
MHGRAGALQSVEATIVELGSMFTHLAEMVGVWLVRGDGWGLLRGRSSSVCRPAERCRFDAVPTIRSPSADVDT